MDALVKHCFGTDAAWASANPTLLAGEIGIVTVGGVPLLKIGDGATAFAGLDYFGTFQDLTVLGNTVLGNAAGDTLTINGTAVSIPNGLTLTGGTLTVVNGTDNGNTLLLADRAIDESLKDGFVTVMHYTNAEEPLAVIQGRVESGTARVLIGGTHLTTTYNVANSIEFYTAAGVTTTPVPRGTINSAGVWTIPTTTSSTSATTGAFVVTGGVGIGENLTIGGTQLLIDNVRPAIRLRENDQVVDERFWEFAVNGKVLSVRAWNDAFSDGHFIFTATRGTGYAISSITIGDSADNPPVTINGRLTVASGQALRLGNAAVAGTPTPTHTVTIQDSSGTVYRVPCVV